MATRFNIHEAKTQFSKLIERTEAGEEIVVARAGKPVVRLVKIVEEPPKYDRRPGRFKHLLGSVPTNIWFEPMDEEELALWEGASLDKFV